MTKKFYTSGFIFTLLVLSLTGCMGIYEGGFECPPGIGAKCKSISDVNEMVNQGEIPKKSSAPSAEEKCTSCGSSDDTTEEKFYQQHVHQVPTIWWAPYAQENER